MTGRHLSRLIFHKDTLALIASMVFFWFTISLLVDSNIDAEDLVPHTGIIVSIDSVITRVVNKPLFKETTKELWLTIDTEADYFSLISTSGFGDISSRIAIEDSVTVFTKPRVWGVFGLAKRRSINQLSKGGEIIIDYNKYKQKISGFFVLTLAGGIVFLILYLNRMRTRYYFDEDYRG